MYNIGGNISGLNNGAKLTLQDKTAGNLDVSANGSFVLPAALANGSTYDVSIAHQPTGQLCVLSQGKGAIASASISNIVVSCKTAYAYVVNFTYAPDAPGSDNYSPNYAVTQYTFGANNTMVAAAVPSIVVNTSQASVTLDASGQYAYVAQVSKNVLQQYSIDAHGHLSSTPQLTLPSAELPYTSLLSPNGKFLYALDYWNLGNINKFDIGANGAISTTPTIVAHVNSALGMAIDSTGKFAYIGNSYSNRIYQFSIAADGSLTPAATASVASDDSPTQIVLDPGNKFAYVVNNYGGTISQYTIQPDGTLASMIPASVRVSARGVFMAIKPDGKYVYASGDNDTILQFSVGPTGALTPLNPASVSSGSGAISMTFDITGQYAYVCNSTDNTVTQYAIGSDGTLSVVGNVATPGQPTQMLLFYR